MMEIRCPVCGSTFKVDEWDSLVECPECGALLDIADDYDVGEADA